MTIIIPNLGEATTARIDRVARQRGVSVEEMVVELIHKGLNLEQESVSLPVYDDLDALAGTWSDTEADDFLRAIHDFDQTERLLRRQRQR